MFRQTVSSLRFNIPGVRSNSGSVTKLYKIYVGRYAKMSESLRLSHIHRNFKVEMVMMWEILCDVCVCVCDVYVCDVCVMCVCDVCDVCV